MQTLYVGLCTAVENGSIGAAFCIALHYVILYLLAA